MGIYREMWKELRHSVLVVMIVTLLWNLEESFEFCFNIICEERMHECDEIVVSKDDEG